MFILVNKLLSFHSEFGWISATPKNPNIHTGMNAHIPLTHIMNAHIPPHTYRDECPHTPSHIQG